MRPDPTYQHAEIAANRVWALAFSMSELDNDNAPIGWARYIPLAEGLLANWHVRRKQSKPAPYAGPQKGGQGRCVDPSADRRLKQNRPPKGLYTSPDDHI